MKINRFNESDNSDNKKIYVYQVHPSDKTYRGSIWDEPTKPWVPNGAKLLTTFEVDAGRQYMTVNQDELDEINKIKEEVKLKRQSKKYNL